MNLHKMYGYLWITSGIICLVIFASKLLIQLFGIAAGLYCILKGLRLIQHTGIMEDFSMDYFERFRK